MFNLILMNLIVALTSFLLVKYFLYFKDISDYLITLFILYFSQITISLQLLGIFNMLYLNNVILLNLSILLIAFSLVKIKKIRHKNNLLASIAYKIDNIKFSKIAIFCLAVILGFGLVKISINLVNPPFGWDDLNYHFTFPVEWLKHGNLDNPISISGDPSVSYYPINGSLFFLWFILPIKNVFIADLGQVPFFIIAFLAIYSIARKLSLSKEYAVFSASLFTLVPNYFKQFEIAYVDVMVAALFLVAINYLFLLYKKNGSVRNIILFSLAVGLMFGTKTTAMPFVPILLLPFIYFCFSRNSLKKSFLLFCLCILLIVITGGFGYIRNFIQTNNPFYPLNLRLFNVVFLKGVIDNMIYRTGIRPGDFSLAKILFSEGLGAQTIIFLLPAIFLGLPVTIIKRKKDLSFNLIYFMVLPILLILVYRFIIPLPNLRYIYSLFAIGLIIAFYVADILKLPNLVLKILVLICVFASMGELARHLELVISLILSFILFFAFPNLLKFIKTKDLSRLLIIFLVSFFTLLIFLEKDYIYNEYERYVKRVEYSGFWPDATKAWLWLNLNTKGNNIAYIGRPVPFPLYGTNFKNNVYYVSVNSFEPAKLHYFPNSKYVWGYNGDLLFRNFEDKANYRGNANYKTWLKNLSMNNTDFLFIYSELISKVTQFPIEEEWAKTHPESFDLVFKNETIHIYKIKK